MQYMRCWAVCMYVCNMSAKNFGSSIVGSKLNCTAACVLCCIVYHYIQSSLSSILYPVIRFRRKLKHYGNRWTSSTNRCWRRRCDRIHQPSATETIGLYTSTPAVITITTIFAILAISKSAKLLDYSSMPSTFGTLFLCLVTNSLKDPEYHGCLC